MITIAPSRPDHPDAAALLDELSESLERITGDSGRNSYDPAESEQPGALFVLARDAGGNAVGCGAFRSLQRGNAGVQRLCEIKRMYSRATVPGVGSAILAHLENAAREAGYCEAWLETRLVNERAVRFYEKAGYRRIPNFGKYAGRPEAVCFAKTLVR